MGVDILGYLRAKHPDVGVDPRVVSEELAEQLNSFHFSRTPTGTDRYVSNFTGWANNTLGSNPLSQWRVNRIVADLSKLLANETPPPKCKSKQKHIRDAKAYNYSLITDAMDAASQADGYLTSIERHQDVHAVWEEDDR